MSTRPTVLLFSWFYHPDIGGAELFVEAISRRLAHQYRFVIVTARLDRCRPAREERSEGLVLRVGIGAPVDKFLYPLLALRTALAVPNVDLVHAVMVNAAALSAWGYLRLRPRPSVLTLQSGDSEAYVKRYMGPVYPLYRFLHRPFDRIHAISSHLRDRAIRFGAPVDAITVIPNGVELERYEPERFDPSELDDLRLSLGITGGRVIVSISRLVLKNGLDTLIRALPLVAAHHPDVRLLVVGEGEDRAKLEALALSTGVQDRTIFTGAIEPGETARYLALSDVFARPSVSEGLGTAFLEAMASRLPVVATPVGGILDIVEEDRNGLFCRIGEPESVARALNKILGDPRLARRLGEEGRALVARDYRWEHVAAGIGKLYDELLGDKAGLATSTL